MVYRPLAVIAIAGATLVAACGGGSPTGTTPATTLATAAGPSPTPSPTTGQPIGSCALGKGDPDPSCARTSGQLLPSVDAAISAVVAAHPDYFVLTEEAGTGQFRVRDRDGLIEGVLAELQGRGMCAQRIPQTDTIQVKDSNSISEEYNVVTSGGFIRRGQASYQTTCEPAAFPLEVGDTVARIFVGIFRFRCVNGVVPPQNYELKLPMACDALITATPKDKYGVNVPLWLHGTNPEIWVRNGEHTVIDMGEVPKEPFNKWIYARGVGPFSICAALHGRQTCMNAQVIP